MAKKLSHKPCDLVLFGTKGDLARRKLIPSLYKLERSNLLADETKIVGVARDDLDLDGYKKGG